jgi:DNA-binding MarR family transcriptional regulator
LAAFNEGLAHASRALVNAAAAERGWRERIGAGLVALLEFLDEYPGWARFVILEQETRGLAITERCQRAVAELARALERETRGKAIAARQLGSSSSLIAEMVVGGALSVVQASLLADTSSSLVELAPSLLAFIFGPYQRGDRGASKPAHLPVRLTYRTTRVLGAIGEFPRSSNREIADAGGLRDEGQTSKLLSRLERRGLVENVGLGAAYGEPNEWLLTRSGKRTLEAAQELSPAGAGEARRRQLVRGAA